MDRKIAPAVWPWLVELGHQGQPATTRCSFVPLCEITSRRDPQAYGQWHQRVPRSLHEKLKIVAVWEGGGAQCLWDECAGRAGGDGGVSLV